MTERYDVVVVGGGHNGLTAAAYLARAGRSVLVLERLDHVGGAAVSARVFDGVDARLSRYSYLVSLLPRQVVDELGLGLRLVRRRYASYTPRPDDPRRGLLVDAADDAATAASFDRIGAAGDVAGWQRLYDLTGATARRLFPTVTGPLPSAAEARALVGDEAWRALVERPLGELVESAVHDDLVRGVVLTDGLIGTFADAWSPTLQQNRCFLYHVVGGGTGDWDVPVGGMGALTTALADVATAAGATLRTGAEVVRVDPDGAVTYASGGRTTTVAAGQVLAGCAPTTLDRLVGEPSTPATPATPDVEGAQLKVNLLLTRLPRLRDDAVDPAAAFGGTFHVNEGYDQLQAAYEQAAAGRVPDVPPCEVYCHSLSDPTILGAELRAAGAQTLTLFGLHLPAALFRADPDGARTAALEATLRSLDSVLAEPVESLLWRTPDGRPCLDVRTPVDLEADLGLPGGNIFHRPLQWPWAERDEDAGTWGVGTRWPGVLLCGAGARRGGGVSGIPGRAAAMAVLAGT